MTEQDLHMIDSLTELAIYFGAIDKEHRTKFIQNLLIAGNKVIDQFNLILFPKFIGKAINQNRPTVTVPYENNTFVFQYIPVIPETPIINDNPITQHPCLPAQLLHIIRVNDEPVNITIPPQLATSIRQLQIQSTQIPKE